MESIHRLRDVLLRVLSGHITLEAEQELFDELMTQKTYKTCLLNVLDIGQRNPEEKAGERLLPVVVDAAGGVLPVMHHGINSPPLRCSSQSIIRPRHA